MRHALLVVVISLLLAPLGALTACGKGGSGGGGDPEGARATLIELLDAGRRDDYGKARPRLDVVEWLVSVGHPQAAAYSGLPQDEQDKFAKACFRGVTGTLKLVNLPDRQAIAAAVGAARIENMPQLKAVKMRFEAPDAERPERMLGVDAKLRYGIDRIWRLVTIEVDL